MRYHRPHLDRLTHLLLLLGVIVFGLPLWLALTASTHSAGDLQSGIAPLWFGSEGLANYWQLLSQPIAGLGVSALRLLGNSLVMALGIAIGKIAISLLAAYAIVFFRFPCRTLCFWLIFITLMLPVEVRIVPTYGVVARFGLIDTYAGMILPLIASATATFLLRQSFMSLPQELFEAARLDGAGPLRFLKDFVLPLSKTNLAALFVIMFIYGWNQYLWPLLAANSPEHATAVISLKNLVQSTDTLPPWQLATAMAVMTVLPPVAVIIAMQRFFVRGLTDTEK
ncbi:sn-glycerol-3-phosphate ABC transporter permease UgpE [Salinicola corii]|uniref:sn-glycerol-3-phosphate transport system permease protein UgpE n=1 Tax=Salinicola corii TaxID=2606937 RepID=A0A640WA47_9GAMM|nr:sn-glycerol-3-phosphate ABC transporter permease UgpE [Salinicola corii]KAA0016023.1 sn-glycerol-3-phosphate ABC transporter permease UgpE [Salinicola corii]